MNNNKFDLINDEINNTKDSINQSLSLIIDRGEKLENLVDKSETLNENSALFNKQAKRLKNKMFWKKVKLSLLLFLILVIIIMIFIFSICGLKFQHCN